MALVLADVGADHMLEIIFNDSWPTAGVNLTIGLFVNDYTPLDTSALGNFTNNPMVRFTPAVGHES